MEIPTTGGDSDLELVQAVKDGKISEKIINQRVDEILDVILPVTAAVAPLEGKPFDVDAHHAMAAKAAGESIVLLKNEGNILPLKKGTKVAVIGEFTQKARYQGADSSVINTPILTTASCCLTTIPAISRLFPMWSLKICWATPSRTGPGAAPSP